MQDTIQEAEHNKGSLGDLLSSRGTVEALIIELDFMKFQQLSGINTVIFYSGKNIRELKQFPILHHCLYNYRRRSDKHSRCCFINADIFRGQKHSLYKDLGFSQLW